MCSMEAQSGNARWWRRRTCRQWRVWVSAARRTRRCAARCAVVHAGRAPGARCGRCAAIHLHRCFLLEILLRPVYRHYGTDYSLEEACLNNCVNTCAHQSYPNLANAFAQRFSSDFRSAACRKCFQRLVFRTLLRMNFPRHVPYSNASFKPLSLFASDEFIP